MTSRELKAALPDTDEEVRIKHIQYRLVDDGGPEGSYDEMPEFSETAVAGVAAVYGQVVITAKVRD